jgi:hypothetical protein
MNSRQGRLGADGGVLFSENDSHSLCYVKICYSARTHHCTLAAAAYHSSMATDALMHWPPTQRGEPDSPMRAFRPLAHPEPAK